MPNRVERGPDGWRFAAPGIVVADAPQRWLEAAREAESLDISLEVRPMLAAQSGPARILTISRDPHLRNLTLGQEDDDLVLRLRTEETDLNGLVGGEPFARVADVFRSDTWVAIDLEIAPGELTIAVDGEPALIAGLPPAVLRTWHSSLGVALGNEMTCDRPWLGAIRKAVVEGPDGRTDYLDGAAVRVPASCWVIGYPPAVVPFRPLLVKDAARNVLMYLPLGCLVGLMIRSRSLRTYAGGLLAIVGVSAAFEITQLFAGRFPSVDDTIFNTLGGALGLGLVFWVTRHRTAPEPAGHMRASTKWPPGVTHPRRVAADPIDEM
jgi:hypothetical protein